MLAFLRHDCMTLAALPDVSFATVSFQLEVTPLSS